MEARLGLVGDRSEGVRAHTAIPIAIRLITEAGIGDVHLDWLATPQLRDARDADLESYDGVWVVPGSPYESMDGALRAIRFARETGRPFLGTCGGFQHALIEYARNVLDMPSADHAESNPESRQPVIERLSCSLVGARGAVIFARGSALARAYGSARAEESYQCNYGLNPSYARVFDGTRLRVGAVDEAGDARAIELDGHPFFVATLFQPELSAFMGHPHPLLRAFLRASWDFAGQRQPTGVARTL